MKTKTENKDRSELQTKTKEKIPKKTKTLRPHVTNDLQTLVHELETHQIELEMQNEELRRARVEMEASHRRYMEIFDFAPIGYFMFDRNGVVHSVNISGAELVGRYRQNIMGLPFSIFVFEEDRNRFFDHLRNVFHVPGIHKEELRLTVNNGSIIHVRLQSAVVEEPEGTSRSCRTSLIDITESKRAGEVLRDREEIIQQQLAEINSIYDSAHVGLCVFDNELRYVRVNDHLARINGISSHEHIGRTVRQILPSLADQAEALHYRILETGEPQLNIEFSGSTSVQSDIARTFLEHWLPLKDSTGKVIGVNVVVEEITEQKRKEERIRHHNIILDGINRIFHETLRSGTEEELGKICLSIAEEITESAFGFIGEIGADGLLHDIAISNPGWEACTMYDKAGHGSSIINIKIRGLFGRILQDGTTLMTNRPSSHPAGTGVPEGHPALTALLAVPLVSNGKTIGMVMMGNKKSGYNEEDRKALEALAPVIVEAFSRRRSEEALLASEVRYRKLVQSANSAIIRLQRDGTITLFNKYAEKLFGYSPSEIIGRHVSIILPDVDSDGVDLTGLFQQVVDYPEHYESNINENICRDGRRIWMNWTNKAVYDETGEVVEILAIGNNISELKQLEDELRVSRDELDYRVRERTAQLEIMNRELQDFAFAASHDLKEPLRKIQTFGDMVAARSLVCLDEASQDYLKRMQTAGKRMQRLIDSLLRYSRVTTMASPMRKINLETSVRTALSNLELMINEKNARVAVGNLPTIQADHVQMIQLFQNLIENALKFQKKDNAPQVRIHSRQGKDKRFCEIYVEDNGIGFNEEHRNRIFSPFQRLHGKNDYAGVGIGLAICRKIVERHGGEINAKSEPGKGSTFIVTLPQKRFVRNTGS